MITLKTTFDKASAIVGLSALGIDNKKTLKELRSAFKAIRKFREEVVVDTEAIIEIKKKEFNEKSKEFEQKPEDSSAQVSKKQELRDVELKKINDEVQELSKVEIEVSFTPESLRELKDVLENIKPEMLMPPQQLGGAEITNWKTSVMLTLNTICEDIEEALDPGIEADEEIAPDNNEISNVEDGIIEEAEDVMNDVK